MRIRFFMVIIVLLLWAIAGRTGEPIVIKDSEAIEYVGKEVEEGRVVSVTTSPLGQHLSISEENTPIRHSPDSLQRGLR